MKYQLRGNAHMTSMKIVRFWISPTHLIHLRPKFFHPLDLGRPITIPPLQMITNQLKETMQGWLLYVIRSFLHVGFRFQYQLINLAWLFIDFFSYSWSRPRPQINFQELKTSFMLSSYSEKMRWDRGWAEASLSTFSWFYILVCVVVQKYHVFYKNVF